jgi:hypothetical protein
VTEQATDWFRFLGLNVRGTPSMRFWRVAADLRVARDNAHVVVLQEFRWPWYWRAARKVLRRARKTQDRWGSSPPFPRGVTRPVRSGQGVMWLLSRFRRLRTVVRLAHEGERKVSEARYWRAVLLEVDETGLCGWFGSGHCVVKADQDDATPLRRGMMGDDLDSLDELLEELVASGLPGMMEADMNIRPGGWAYARFRAILAKHGCRLVGPAHGVEYLWFWNGTDSRFQVAGGFQIPTKMLHTDHEGRGARARIVAIP